uniref:Uncharacterized protein n=1 Tax=Glossina palpalis gambiensis TaxID=67801 RepID=A0A1B0C514_9MUSC
MNGAGGGGGGGGGGGDGGDGGDCSSIVVVNVWQLYWFAAPVRLFFIIVISSQQNNIAAIRYNDIHNTNLSTKHTIQVKRVLHAQTHMNSLLMAIV